MPNEEFVREIARAAEELYELIPETADAQKAKL